MTIDAKVQNKSYERTLKRLKALEDISYTCANLYTSDLRTVTNKVLKPFCELTGADYGIVLLLTQPENQIYLSATYGLPSEFSSIYNNKLKFKLNKNEIYETWPSVRSIIRKQIIIVKDANEANVGFSKFFSEAISPNKIRSVVSIPIIINYRAVGAVAKYFVNRHNFDDEEISFMKTTANIMTSIIERNLLIEGARKSERELTKTNDTLLLKNKELDSFVYIASHDLREPLRTIESFVSIIQDKIREKLDEVDIDYISRIVRATQKMRRLIEDLTLLSRASRDINGKENEIVDLNQLLKEVQFELTAFLQNKNAEIVILDKLPLIVGNKEKISSLLKNLITNGIKFNKSLKPLINISVARDQNIDPSQNKICLCVKDNGIGIKKEYQDKIFGLFQRLHTEEEYEGTGAGLAIVKKILEKYNCNIWLNSEEGKGSKFYFTLPLASNE